jgi:hypothetical protein
VSPDEQRFPSCATRSFAIVPDVEQCISYGMTAFRLRGKTIAGSRLSAVI